MLDRLEINITGFVQGVGFRPFVYKLAQELKLTGWVCNDLNGVRIELQGTNNKLDLFLDKLKNDLPTIAKIITCKVDKIPSVYDEKDFVINFSDSNSTTTAIISPDQATCKDCKQDIFDPSNRRYLYPFTNCTQCGPRYSIIKALPYDRCNTSMNNFKMCKECLDEYHNVENRRFHAQPNACWDCGPQMDLIYATGEILARRQEAVFLVIEELRKGKIIAIKGLGGFHLFADARNNDAVLRLRKQKDRNGKPLAIMVPSLQWAYKLCDVGFWEEKLLTCQQAPIVILPRKDNSIIASSVAPNNPYLGIMLPYMPLHHILLKELDFPVVATSGNLSGEPICKEG